jgi:hypothetical protein
LIGSQLWKYALLYVTVLVLPETAFSVTVTGLTAVPGDVTLVKDNMSL